MGAAEWSSRREGKKQQKFSGLYTILKLKFNYNYNEFIRGREYVKNTTGSITHKGAGTARRVSVCAG